MPRKKPEALREMKTDELEQQLVVLTEERFRLGFRRATEAPENPVQLRAIAHGFYGKQVVRTKQVAAHDEQGAKAGDTVRIVVTRPLSKTKRWRVVDIVERAK